MVVFYGHQMTWVNRLLTNDIIPPGSMDYALLFALRTVPTLPHVVCQCSAVVPVVQTKRSGIWRNLIV